MFFHPTRGRTRTAPTLLTRALGLAGAAALVAGSALAQEATNASAQPVAAQSGASAAPSDEEILGAPLVIDGQTISADALKRHITLSTEGRTMFELAKLRVFIEREMQRQLNEDGKSVEDFRVDAAEVQEVIDDARAQVEQQYEGQDVSLEDVLPEVQSDSYLDNVKLSKLFRRVYLPDNPNEYPPISVTAITAGEQGEQLYAALIDTWEQQQAEAESAGPDAPGEAQVDAGQQFMNMMLQQMVVGYLTENAAIQLPEDGIADHLLGVVDGLEIEVEPIWQRIKSKVGPADVWRAKMWFVNTYAAEKALKEAGAWIPWEESMAMYEEYSAPYKESFLSIEKIATMIKKFPTLGAYQRYYQIQESFRKLRAHEMTDEALEEQGDRKTSYLVSQAKVDVDIILLSAYDFATKSWKEDGWAQAEARAIEAAQALASGTDWNEVLEQYSEFYDPPIPTAQQNSPDLKLKNKGRFRGITRNDMLRMLEESDYSIFVSGSSITDRVFFDQAVGTIENPVRGPHGWYIPRLLRKTPPTTRLSVSDEDHREYLMQDWIAENLNAFVQEQVAQLEFSGVER